MKIKNKTKKKMVLRKDFFITDNEKLENCYEFDEKEKVLGFGTFGKVIIGTQKNTTIKRAIKILPKTMTSKKSSLLNEINILKTLDHPNIIKLYQTFEDTDNYYLVFELCKGGELFDNILEKGHFSEDEAKKIFRNIIKALHHCHQHGICHRDLKPENFLLADKKDLSMIKMIDFGLSSFYLKSEKKKKKQKENKVKKKRRRSKLTTKAGTSYYIAPEVLNGCYDEKCDIWSAGVILYILLSGYPPFGGANDWEILIKVKKGKFDFESEEWQNVSAKAKDLITNMICPTKRRFSTQEVLNHSWFHTNKKEKKAAKLDMRKLKNYVKSNKLKKVVLNYIATQTDTNEIKDLINLFNKLDDNKDGFLTNKEFTEGLKSNNMDSKTLDKIFKTIDFDNNGKISYTEFVSSLISKEIYFKEDKLRQAFRLFDQDGDGSITFEELRNIIGKECNVQFSQQYWKNLVSVVDVNGDGSIDFEEFIKMLK